MVVRKTRCDQRIKDSRRDGIDGNWDWNLGLELRMRMEMGMEMDVKGNNKINFGGGREERELKREKKPKKEIGNHWASYIRVLQTRLAGNFFVPNLCTQYQCQCQCHCMSATTRSTCGSGEFCLE